jgi:hypothetical protein
MKKMFNYLLVGTMALGLFAAQSCSKTCDAGYEGSDCKTLSSTKFLGTYSEADTLNGVAQSAFSTTITSGTTPDKILIKNLGFYNCLDTAGNNLDYYVEATVKEKAITLASTSCKTVFAGTGVLGSDGHIYLNYSATYTSGGTQKTDNLKSGLKK